MLIKLTNIKDETILIGIESIIDVKEFSLKQYMAETIFCTKIQSRGAMVETNYVRESVEEIWDMVQAQLLAFS